MKTFDSAIQEPLSGIAKNIANSGDRTNENYPK